MSIHDPQDTHKLIFALDAQTGGHRVYEFCPRTWRRRCRRMSVEREGAFHRLVERWTSRGRIPDRWRHIVREVRS